MQNKFRIEVRQLKFVGGQYLYKRIGQIDTYLSLDVILRFNDVGTWSLVVPAGSPQSALLGPGRGIVVWYEGLTDPVCTGPVREIQKGWDSASEGNEWPGTVTFSGPDDNSLMAEHLCLPAPAQGLVDVDSTAAVNMQFSNFMMTKAYDTFVDTSDPKNPKSAPFSMERLLRRLVYDNFGDGNIAGRKVNGLSFVAPGSWPAATAYPQTTYSLRNETVLEAVKNRAETCVMSDNSTKAIGYRWVWDEVTEKIAMKIFYPVNTPGLGKSVRFSRENGNLAAFNYTLTAPKSNWMLFGLDQETAEQPQTQHFYIADKRTDTTDWAMSAESFKDETSVSVYIRDQDGLLILDAGLNKQLDKKTIATTIDTAWQDEAPVGSLSVTPIDTDGCKFGVHYWLGDLVTIVEDEQETTSVLREVHLSDSSSGPTIQSTIGDSSATATPAIYKEIKKIWLAMRKAQKTKNGAVYSP